jgi:hypothetical protein
LVLLLISSALFYFFAPGIFESAWFLTFHASSSRSESMSISCYATPFTISFEFSLFKTPSKDLFYVNAYLLNITLLFISYKQIFFEFPPPRTNYPFGLMQIELKCLFLVEFNAVVLSSLNLPPFISYLQSIILLIELFS